MFTARTFQPILRVSRARTITTSLPRLSVQAPDAGSNTTRPGVQKPVEPSDPAYKKQQDAHIREKDSGSPDKVPRNETPESTLRDTGSGADAGAGVTGDAGMQKGKSKGGADELKKGKEVGKEAGSAGSVPRSG